MSLLDLTNWQGLIYSDGWIEGGGGAAPVVEPATGTELAQVGVATPTDVTKAASRAADAQRDWAAQPYAVRAAVLRRAGQLFTEHAAEIADWLVRESGAIRPFAEFQTQVAAEECFAAAALAAEPYGQLLRTAAPRLSMARRVPVGVAGVIAPFNAPIVLAIRAIAPALALGNAVVCKPDPRTAVSGGVVFARVFEEAGLPAGLLHVLSGDAAVGAALVEAPEIGVIAFTGSTGAGRAVATLAAKHLKRVHLELGGNSALVVLDDVDLEAAVSVGAFGSFNHAGQICMATGRHLVHHAVAEEYVRVLAAHAEKLPVGDPTGAVAIGPMIDAGQRDRVHGLVTSSVEAGAELVTGGSYDDLFYKPTVLGGVTPEVPAFSAEIFGPVAPVSVFHDLDEAVRLATATPYGLSLGILTRDVMAGLALAERIPTGLVHINDQTVNDEPNAPFGGLGDSGTGSRHGGSAANLDAFTETQWVTVRGDLPKYPF
ncbi:benzaldehyde dehydrogenase [Nocardioides sp. NPDC006273]|uniref:benzaldehyde dehydrogenase n=1 Tax=Nocardioides sp. NPDC006273 TaxID=3155598 RepID=UPI0033B55826